MKSILLALKFSGAIWTRLWPPCERVARRPLALRHANETELPLAPNHIGGDGERRTAIKESRTPKNGPLTTLLEYAVLFLGAPMGLIGGVYGSSVLYGQLGTGGGYYGSLVEIGGFMVGGAIAGMVFGTVVGLLLSRLIGGKW